MSVTVVYGRFEWDKEKEAENYRTHGVDFKTAAQSFRDPGRLIVHDEKHSEQEQRLFCIGMVDKVVLTVRFTMRKGRVRIIGAGAWRKGKKLYEEKKG